MPTPARRSPVRTPSRSRWTWRAGKCVSPRRTYSVAGWECCHDAMAHGLAAVRIAVHAGAARACEGRRWRARTLGEACCTARAVRAAEAAAGLPQSVEVERRFPAAAGSRHRLEHPPAVRLVDAADAPQIA